MSGGNGDQAVGQARDPKSTAWSIHKTQGGWLGDEAVGTEPPPTLNYSDSTGARGLGAATPSRISFFGVQEGSEGAPERFR